MAISAIFLPVMACRRQIRPDYTLEVTKGNLAFYGKDILLEESLNRVLPVVRGPLTFTASTVGLWEGIDYTLTVTKGMLTLAPKTLTANYKIGITNAGIGFTGKDITLTRTEATETTKLSGTASVPNTIYSEGIPGFVSAYAGLRANINGSLEGENISNLWAAAYTINTNEWIDNASYTDEYWIRATTVNSYSSNLTGTLNTWMKLNDNSRQWSIFKSATVDGERWHILKLEISTDSGGSTIVATGYYKLYAVVGFA